MGRYYPSIWLYSTLSYCWLFACFKSFLKSGLERMSSTRKVLSGSSLVSRVAPIFVSLKRASPGVILVGIISTFFFYVVDMPRLATIVLRPCPLDSVIASNYLKVFRTVLSVSLFVIEVLFFSYSSFYIKLRSSSFSTSKYPSLCSSFVHIDTIRLTRSPEADFYR